MSDELANAAAAGDAGAVSTDAAPTPSAADASQASPANESTDLYGGEDYSGKFGLEPETSDEPAPIADPMALGGPATPPPDDVNTAADTPVPHQDEKTVTTPQTDQDDAAATESKLNWDDKGAPKQFREEFKALTKAYQEATNPENNWQSAYLTDKPEDFVKRLAETSPTAYNEVGSLIATESAKANPAGWLAFFATENPEVAMKDGTKVQFNDYIAQAISGKPGMMAERLKAELAVLDAEDEDDVQAAMEKSKPADAKPEETPEQKQLRDFLTERKQNQLAEVQREVFSPIESSVDALISDAGLEIKDDVWQQDFSKLDEDTQYRRVINELIPVYIDMRIKDNPAYVNLQNRLDTFLKAGDRAGAQGLQHQAKIIATNAAGEFLSLVTGYKARSKQSDNQAPVQQAPKPHVSTGGQSSAAITAMSTDANGNAPDWKVTDADMFRAKR